MTASDPNASVENILAVLRHIEDPLNAASSNSKQHTPGSTVFANTPAEAEEKPSIQESPALTLRSRPLNSRYGYHTPAASEIRSIDLDLLLHTSA